MSKSGLTRDDTVASAPGGEGASAPRPVVGEPDAAMPDPVRGSVWITGQLRQAILDGRYAPGEKLPAERKFASAFGASRATIRTALSRLETERLVTRRLGAGTFVNTDVQAADEEVAELTSPLELIDVRLGIEPNMVRLAVLNATAAYRNTMTESAVTIFCQSGFRDALSPEAGVSRPAKTSRNAA